MSLSQLSKRPCFSYPSCVCSGLHAHIRAAAALREPSAGLMFKCCPREETSWQELKFQQVNPVGKCLLRMFWFPALGLRSQQQVLPGVSMRRGRAAAAVLCAHLPAWTVSPCHCTDWEWGHIYCGNVSGQLNWNNCRSLYSVTFFLETGQSHFKQQQNPFLCNLTNLLCLNQSCMKIRKCASKG